MLHIDVVILNSHRIRVTNTAVHGVIQNEHRYEDKKKTK